MRLFLCVWFHFSPDKVPTVTPFLAHAWPAAGPRGALRRDGQTRQASNSERFLRMMMIRPIGCLFETHYEGGESEAEGPLGGHGVEPTCPLEGRQALRCHPQNEVGHLHSVAMNLHTFQTDSNSLYSAIDFLILLCPF